MANNKLKKVKEQGGCESAHHAVARCLFGILLLLLLNGCAVGLDSVMFATKTQLGIDADMRPPTLDFGYARREGVIQPAVKEGKTLPVLSSLGAKGGFSIFGVDQSFATGDAALVISKLLNKPGGYEPQPEEGTIKARAMSRQLEDRRPLFFGTKTNFGAHIEFSEAQLPTAIHIGWKRGELALAPLVESAAKSNNPHNEPLVDMKLVSLLATVGAGVHVDQPKQTAAQVSQMFATGKAATYLAQHQEVRQVLAPYLFPGYEKIKEAFESTRAAFQKQSAIAGTIIKDFKALSDQGKQESVFAAAVNLGVIDEEFKDRSPQDKQKLFGPHIVKFVNRNEPNGLDKLNLLKTYIDNLP